MNAQQTFVHFVNHVLTREKAERFTSLSSTSKGQQKIFNALCHEFEPAILPAAVRRKDYQPLLDKPCFVFYGPMGFGVEVSAVANAYEKLSIEDSWLILLTDGSAGIHRPEWRWDDEKLLVVSKKIAGT